MKNYLIIIAPLLTISIALIGYGSDYIFKTYYWEPKLKHAKTNSVDFECEYNLLIPFFVTTEFKGHLDGKYHHENM